METSNSNRFVSIIIGILLVGLIAATGMAATIFVQEQDGQTIAISESTETTTANDTTVQTINQPTAAAVDLDNTNPEADLQEETGVALDPVVQESVQTEAQTTATDLEQRLINLYSVVNPSVVHIFVFAEDFPQGTGTGFIYDEAGHIITNNHVVEGGDRYEVVFPTGERFPAEYIGSDVDSDLGVLQVAELPVESRPLPFGNSREIQVGQFVIAIGNPFGQESSMSFGIVSGLGRSLPSQRVAEGGGRYSLPQVIQTDAPINPGNSGGPLIDLNGNVVGINAAIRSETGANTGVGFSIPINIAKRVVPAIIAEGSYTYPYLGVSIAPDIDLTAQEQLDLPQTSGAYVTTVAPDGPAGQAGLIGASAQSFSGGDLIIAIDGETVRSFDDLISYLVFETEVGQTVTLTVIRNGETVDVPVELGARP